MGKTSDVWRGFVGSLNGRLGGWRMAYPALLALLDYCLVGEKQLGGEMVGGEVSRLCGL